MTFPAASVDVNASGAEAASDAADVKSPETYVGYDRSEPFNSPGGVVQDAAHTYAAGDTGAQRMVAGWQLDRRSASARP